MINWISSEDEKNVRKIDYDNLQKVINLAKYSNDEMTKYVCEIFEEYKDLISSYPYLLKEVLIQRLKDDFIIDGEIGDSDILLSSSDANAYNTVKLLNKNRKVLTVVCFDMHSDTYDYNDSLWKGNCFSKLMHEGYVTHYVVIGVPLHKRDEVLKETDQEIIDRVHLIDEENLFQTLEKINCKNIFISIDVDCLNSRQAKYTAIEYSPATVLNNVSHIDSIDINTLDKQIRDCIYVKNELGFSNYYCTGENKLTVENVVDIINNIIKFCGYNSINLGLCKYGPFLQIMEVNGYDYGNLTSEMVIKLINKFSRKGGDEYEKRILGKS